MQRSILFLLSAIGFTVGCLILIFGADLHNRYTYGATYSDALHVSAPPGIVMLIGGVIAILGVIGMVRSLLQDV
jgi:hypothetical protein